MNEPLIACEGNALWCGERAAAFDRSGKQCRRRAALAIRRAFQATQKALLSPEPSEQRSLLRTWAQRWIDLSNKYTQQAERSTRRSGKLQEAANAWHSASGLVPA